MADTLRRPAVAGSFYSGNATVLQQEIASFFAEAETSSSFSSRAIISPHAGYVYSGRVAARTMACVEIPRTVIIIGPNHHGHGQAVALSGADAWDTPLGPVPVNKDLSQKFVKTSSLFVIDDSAHALEHSLEVQVPLLQYRNPEIKIVPLVVGGISLDTCRQLGEAIARVIAGEPEDVLIVASSDMTHYKPRATASTQDQLALEHVKSLDWQGLYQTVALKKISMCGVLPVVITLVAAQVLGGTHAEVVQYTDSGEVNGDTSQVVGYAGVVVQ